ncbi:hypothetical protein [Gemmata obscuriglobus]|uniref:Uncharacterized protein n=1 Tax=Gemmata obscuriglobus TaxID=114 RepID=A0A2Z3HB44_9BACT|nr:hypothetical protein [Gemmata obscuriglobus]AWM40175.1 hypothetical protein C1280_26345 [Gemmata obscuriglobus]
MRQLSALAGVIVLAATVSARADDRPLLQRIAERTPKPHTPVEHSAARAGYPLSVKAHAVPSVTRFDHGGYVGGGSLKGNSLLARGPGSALGAPCVGTYGTDFGGFRAHLGRVFLAPSVDPSTGKPIQKLYNADGPRVVDVLALRPLRKAVLERREDMEHAKEGHGGGHGADAGHGGEAKSGGEAKGGGH